MVQHFRPHCASACVSVQLFENTEQCLFKHKKFKHQFRISDCAIICYIVWDDHNKIFAKFYNRRVIT